NGNAVSLTRNSNGNINFDNFGIGQAYKRYAQDVWRRSLVFVDDVTYTVDVDGGIDNSTPFRFSDALPDNADFVDSAFVDGEDFLAWQRGFGVTSGAAFSQGDANHNGAVDGTDFNIWKTQFGSPSISVAAAASVPEP